MPIDYLDHLKNDSQRFLELLEVTDPQTPVPTCPDWTADDLLWHLGEVQWFWGTIVSRRVQNPSDLRDAERPNTRAGLIDFFETNSANLQRALRETPQDTEVWTWFPGGHSVGFLYRRQAHEAVIHRVDAELTAGRPSELDPDLATDGVAEVLETMHSIVPRWADYTPGPNGVVTTTDTQHTWLVQAGRWSGTSPRTDEQYTDKPSLTVVDSGEPTFEISGTSRDLDLWLWNRPATSTVSVTGDADGFLAAVRLGVH